MKKFKKRSFAKLVVGSLCLVGAAVTCQKGVVVGESQKGTELCEIYYSINILVNNSRFGIST